MFVPDNTMVTMGDKMKVGHKAILALKNATGLTTNEAKTVVYWAIATQGLDKLDCFPTLVIYGVIETGKSTILKFVSQLINAHIISTTSRAEFRDQLRKNRIVCIEEGDNVEEDKILKRYERESGQVDIKTRSPWGFTSIDDNLYGATVLHRRYSFESLALQSRTIIVKTKKVDRDFYKTELSDEYKSKLEKLWKNAWKRRGSHIPSGRTATNWWPLIIVAQYREDDKWIEYAHKQQAKTRRLLKQDSDFEPEAVLAHALYYFREEKKKKFVYLTKLIEHLNDHYMWKPTSKSVAKILREELGYTIKHHKLGHAVTLE